MIVKFLGNKGGGSAAATMDYLLGKDRDRVGAVLLSGDPDLTERIADNLDFRNRYTVGVLSFEEGNLDQQQKQDIMQSFEKTLLAGLDRDQYDITWIEHTDKGRLELNFVIPNVELSTGKRLQPYFDKADRPIIENWKQVTNFEYGLTDPHAPDKAQAIKILSSQNLPESVKEIKEKIGEAIAEQISKGAIQSRQDVVQTLKGAGFEISRETDRSISIKNPDGKRNIRLEGVIYENRQFDKQFAEEHSRAGQDYQRTSRERYETALGKLHRLIDSKQQGNREHFKVKPSDDQRPAAEHQKRFAFEYSHRNDSGRTGYDIGDVYSGKSLVRNEDQGQATRTRRDKPSNRSDSIGEADFTQSRIKREQGQESILHRGEEWHESQNRRNTEQGSPSNQQLNKQQSFNTFENAFNKNDSDQTENLFESESLFVAPGKSRNTSKVQTKPVVSVNRNEDYAKRLFESLQRIAELFRAAVERAKRSKSKSERTDRDIERSASTIDNAERGITQSESAVKQSQHQITRAEQHIDAQIKLEQQSHEQDYGITR